MMLTFNTALVFLEGQERFTWMTRVYYKDAKGCIIMFDVTSKNSFLNVAKWKDDLDSKCLLPNGTSVPCLLLANKVGIYRMTSLFYQSNIG